MGDDILDMAFEDEFLESGETIIINEVSYECVSDPLTRFAQDNSRHAGKYETICSLHVLKSSGIKLSDLEPSTNAKYKDQSWLIDGIEDDENAVRLTLSLEKGKRQSGLF